MEIWFASRSCVEICESSGSCQPPISSDVPKIVPKWRLWGCRSDCRHTCVRKTEMERRELGLEPVKYHGKWANTQSGYLKVKISIKPYQSSTKVCSLCVAERDFRFASSIQFASSSSWMAFLPPFAPQVSSSAH